MKYKISRYAALHGVTYRTVWNWIGQGRKISTCEVMEDAGVIEPEDRDRFFVDV